MAKRICKAAKQMEENKMSLLDTAMTDCVMLIPLNAPDGVGGGKTTWSTGDNFLAAIDFNTSIAAKTAEAQGVKSLYTVTTYKTIVLKFNDVFRRLSDDKIFRATSDGDDKYTPETAMLNMRQINAEEWILPS